MSDPGTRSDRAARVEAILSQGVILTLAAGVLALFILGLDGGGPRAPANPAPSGMAAPDRG